MARGAAGLVTAPFTLVKEGALTVGDAVGRGVYGALNAITGSDIPYHPDGAVFQSIDQNGVAGTVGTAITGAVKGIVAPIDAINRRDWGAFGESVPGTLLVGAGAFGKIGSTGDARDGALIGVRDTAAAGPNGASLPLGGKRLQLNQPESPWYQPIRSDPTTIGDTGYTGHAIDRMQDRGFMPSVAQNTIDTGVATPSRLGTTVYYDPVNNVSVVTNAQGKVVTGKYGR